MRGWPSPGQAGTVLINPKRPGSLIPNAPAPIQEVCPARVRESPRWPDRPRKALPGRPPPPPPPRARRELGGGGAVLREAHHSSPAGHEAGSGMPRSQEEKEELDPAPGEKKRGRPRQRSRLSGGTCPEGRRAAEPRASKVSGSPGQTVE